MVRIYENAYEKTPSLFKKKKKEGGESEKKHFSEITKPELNFEKGIKVQKVENNGKMFYFSHFVFTIIFTF